MAGVRGWIGLTAAVLVAAMSLALVGSRDPAHAATPDPTARGPYAVETFDYDAGEFMVHYGERSQYPERLRGTIHRPAMNGRRPLIVLLHGNHPNCRVVVVEYLVPGCPESPATTSVENHTGYEWLSENLASHGYVVLSASANGTNGATFITEDTGTEGRVQVLERTLALVEQWNAKAQPPVGDALVGRVDLSRIGLMGHSRGGEAVTRFITHNRTTLNRRWRLRAVVALAATDFDRQRPAGVPFAALLPTCDGDVFDLQGARAFERAVDDAPRVQWVVRGANHDFFNTVWTQDDGGQNPNSPCREAAGTRLTADGQRHVALFLMGAFLRRHVGDEVAFDAAASGGAVPAGQCIERCEDVVRTTYQAASKDWVGLPTPRSGPVSITWCNAEATPCPSAANRSWTPQLFLRWTQPAQLGLSTLVTDLRGRTIVLRVATDRDHTENNGAAAVALRVVDARGRTATVDLRHPALKPLDEWVYGEVDYTDPAFYLSPVIPSKTGPAHVVLSDVRVPASAFARVDVGHVERISLVLGPRGALYLGGASIQ